MLDYVEKLSSCFNFQPRNFELIVWTEFERGKGHGHWVDFELTDNFKASKTYSGKVTDSMRKRMRKALEALFISTESRLLFNKYKNKRIWFKLSHLTLTLSGYQRFISDSEIYNKCFKPFIRHMKEIHGMTKYFWKAERQLNGNLHYHVLSNLYLDLEIIRNTWNRFQDNLGFITDFCQVFHHRNAPSIDIRYVRNSLEIRRYIMKYMSKNQKNETREQNRLKFYPVKWLTDMSELSKWADIMEHRQHGLIDGKVWDCSDNLKGFKFNSVDLSSEDQSIVSDLVKRFSSYRFDSDYFTYISFPDDQYLTHCPNRLKQAYIDNFRYLIEKEKIRSMEKRYKLMNNPK